MDTTINEGFQNLIAVQAESSFLGAVTGSARYLPGKVAFQYQPRLISGVPGVNVWRDMDGDSFSGRYYEGSFDLMYSHGETIALILSSLLRRSGSSPNYVFAPSHRSDRQSLAIGLSYLPNGQHLVFRGVIIESALVTIRAREQMRIKFDFKAANMTEDGPLTSPLTETQLTATGLQASVEYGGNALPRAYDGSFQIINRIGFENYDEEKIPTGFVRSGRLTFSSDIAEWMSNDPTEGDAIASDVRELAESNAIISVVPSAGKLLELEIGRLLARSGTPPGIQATGIGYRAGVEAQTSEDRTDRPVLTMTI